jgi:type I restriction enzyme, R subunit
LIRLGYQYLSIKNQVINPETNIFADIFRGSLKRINKDATDADVASALDKITLVLDNDDLGRAFYEMLISGSEIKLIDFDNFDNNSFHVVTELTYKNGEEEFRPDITILINGLPLAFIEVKKPNNHQGILAERDRINVRFKNSKFKRFINLTQLLVFSNNMEYGDQSINPLQGAFYATTSLQKADFNNFREEKEHDLNSLLKPLSDGEEDYVLHDNNKLVLKTSPEFITNKSPNTPTNHILTSLFSRERLKFILRYAIAYVDDPEQGLLKHIMRYPQLFATEAIRRYLDAGETKGIIWHTQGSGKTALAFYNVRYLMDYYRSTGVIPKFYFIVDRLDLMDQASSEFTMRGLKVRNIGTREDFTKEFQQAKATYNFDGKPEITVINIQKFQDDTGLLRQVDYNISTQRVYFLDEAHRSYKANGSFLANLYTSDRKAVKIALTGTPLILRNNRQPRGKESPKTTRQIFGDYIHKYYYDASIADGYTLRLIREGIQSNFRIELEAILREIKTREGSIDKQSLYAHDRFVTPMLEYIVKDFVNSRIRFGDKTIGGMVVCDSSDQARKLHKLFTEHYGSGSNHAHKLTSALILSDEGTKQERRDLIDEFKKGKIDLLFVYNMLLTGFDAKRLKKLYLGRVVKAHNLLQTLTRVNRPYSGFQFGYVVDFADISHEFDMTNRAYFDELNQLYGEELLEQGDTGVFDSLFRSQDDIENDLREIYDKLFSFDLKNAEVFSQQINQISDREQMLEIKKALESARSLFNVAKLSGHDELLERIDFHKLAELYNEASRRLDLLNLAELMKQGSEDQNILNAALENVVFTFTKVSEEELVLADRLKDVARKAREGLASNFDPADPMYVSLYEELQRLFKKRNIAEMTQDDMQESIKEFKHLFKQIAELNRQNENLRTKYHGDAKYARVHKRLRERSLVSQHEVELYEVLMGAKSNIDSAIAGHKDVVTHSGYIERLIMQKTVDSFDQHHILLTDTSAPELIRDRLAKEYREEYEGVLV